MAIASDIWTITVHRIGSGNPRPKRPIHLDGKRQLRTNGKRFPWGGRSTQDIKNQIDVILAGVNSGDVVTLQRTTRYAVSLPLAVSGIQPRAPRIGRKMYFTVETQGRKKRLVRIRLRDMKRAKT